MHTIESPITSVIKCSNENESREVAKKLSAKFGGHFYGSITGEVYAKGKYTPQDAKDVRSEAKRIVTASEHLLAVA